MPDDFDFEDSEEFDDDGPEDLEALEDVVGDSNAGAYQKAQLRQGPPLEYVAEKIEYSLEQLHRVLIVVKGDLIDSDVKDRIEFSIRAAFQYELTAFLALHNLLAPANDPHLTERLLNLSADGFEEWLQNMRSEGSVTGL